MNDELVRAGLAWWFRKYAPKDEQLATLEAEAEREKRGLWVEPDPIPPWEWRKQRREKGALRTLKAEVVPNGVEIVALLPNPEGPKVLL